MTRDTVLKNFWEKLKLAKQMNVKDVRMTTKEMDDLGYCIFELMAEYYNKTIDNVKNSDNNDYGMDGGKF